MSKRVLLTGAGGAIGVHVIAHIMHNTDWEIVALDSFRRDHKGQFDRITMVCKDHPDWPERIQVFTHDLNAPLTDRQITTIGKIDYVVNLASRSDVQNSVEDPEPFVRNNVELMLNVLNLCQRVKPEKILHFSTDEVYGAAEKDSKGHPEWDVILPSNPYSASKACQEALAIAWWRTYGLPIVITNTMNNFGSMQAPSKFPAMIQMNIERGIKTKVHVSSDGQMGTRYYIHSRNSADAILFILKNVTPKLHTPGDIDRPDRFNIVGDKQVDNLELVKIISELMGVEPQYEFENFHDNNPGHDLHYGLDGTKLSALGWSPPLSFEESMKDTIEWQQKNKEWMEGK